MATGMTKEEAESLRNSLLEAIRPELEKVVDDCTDRKKVEVAPLLTQKGLQYQASFNVELINILEPLSRIEGAEKIQEAATGLLKKRNTELVFADSSPDGFRVLEKMQALSALTGGAASSSSSTSDATTQMLLFSQMIQQENRARKRHASPQLFRKEGLSGSRSDSSRNHEVESLRREINELRRGRGMEQNRQAQRCYSCHGVGHYANACPQRRTFPR